MHLARSALGTEPSPVKAGHPLLFSAPGTRKYNPRLRHVQGGGAIPLRSGQTLDMPFTAGDGGKRWKVQKKKGKGCPYRVGLEEHNAKAPGEFPLMQLAG